jgi:D-alanine-D-alanine ligase
VSKLKVGILFGGCSPEHEISLLSAGNVIRAMDPNKYELVLIGIDKKGKWLLPDQHKPLLDMKSADSVRLNEVSVESLALLPGQQTQLLCEEDSRHSPGKIDVIFPILHGPMGEDGTIQGLLRFVGIPCVGAGVLSSAACMDKEVTKCLLKQASLPTPDFICVRSHEKHTVNYQEVIKRLGSPVFIKPANLGSSVGISKAKDEASFYAGIEDAFQYDHKILIEEAVIGREIEVGVLGNEHPEVSVPGEAIPNDEFYTYTSKYTEGGVRIIIPADLPKKTVSKIQDYAKKAFVALSCQGMARIDFFVRGEEVFINELNTIPGFTSMSAFPQLWKASGIAYEDLIERVIRLAIEAHEKDSRLKRSY